MNKVNNTEIKMEQWLKCSDYAKNDLKRKALIVVDEVLFVLNEIATDSTDNYNASIFYLKVKDEIINL